MKGGVVCVCALKTKGTVVIFTKSLVYCHNWMNRVRADFFVNEPRIKGTSRQFGNVSED
jgi:hypothetical protein